MPCPRPGSEVCVSVCAGDTKPDRRVTGPPKSSITHSRGCPAPFSTCFLRDWSGLSGCWGLKELTAKSRRLWEAEGSGPQASASSCEEGFCRHLGCQQSLGAHLLGDKAHRKLSPELKCLDIHQPYVFQFLISGTRQEGYMSHN